MIPPATITLYYNAAAFQEVGLDPDHPPATWTDWIAAARRVTESEGGQTTRWGVTTLLQYETLGWLVSGFAMSNGGQYFSVGYGGEVYHDEPSTIGALRFLDDPVHQHHVMPPGMNDPNSAAAFFSGRTAMIVNSTGALGFIRDNMKLPFSVAFVPRAPQNAVPIGGASPIIPRGNSTEHQAAAWALIGYLSSPAIAGRWSRFTGYFAPNRAACDLPDMKDYLAKNPDAGVALDRLQYARPWFATYNTVAVRKAIEDQVQAMLSGRIDPDAAAANARKAADALLKPSVDQTALRPLE